MAERTKRLTMHENLLYHTIKDQAGTLQYECSRGRSNASRQWSYSS